MARPQMTSTRTPLPSQRHRSPPSGTTRPDGLPWRARPTTTRSSAGRRGRGSGGQPSRSRTAWRPAVAVTARALSTLTARR